MVKKNITLALDAMGGDDAPSVVIEGASLSLQKYPDLRFLIFGDEHKIAPFFKEYPDVKEASTLIHTKDVVSNEDKPSFVIRNSRQSSMWLAIEAVAKGQADGVVSAGNTGALMAVARLLLKMTPGISRPAIATVFPTAKGPKVVLDLGANVACDADMLIQFAIMGNVYAKNIGYKKPTVGLLNVGEEELKGNSMLHEVRDFLKDVDPDTLNFQGFVEGDDIMKGRTDVVVTDGFTGNALLKASEGIANYIFDLLRNVFRTSWLTRMAYLFLRRQLKLQVKDHLDPRVHNGAILIGLGGVAIKSHGSADGFAFSNAISAAEEMVEQNLNQQIKDDLQKILHPTIQEDK